MKIVRDIFSPDFTLGQLVCGGCILQTCEDAVRPIKIPGVTAIPSGKYKVVITFSQRFQKPLPLLLDVPNYLGVRIHSGNTAADTEGCILVGTARIKGGVSNSRLAMGLLIDAMEADMKAGKDVFIEIV